MHGGDEMSKLIDKLKQVSKTEPPPIGFMRVQASLPKAKILLIADVPQTDIAKVAVSVAGADAGLIRISNLKSVAKVINDAVQTVPGIPWGVWLKEVDETGELDKAADFIVFSPAAPLGAFKGEDNGKILEIEPALGEGLLIGINELPLNAVLINNESASQLTWHDLMLFRRTARFLNKPLLVTAPAGVSGNELKALWEAGVDGIVVQASTGKIKDLRQLIDSLSFPLPRKQAKREALLPHIVEAGEPKEEEEEEGE